MALQEEQELNFESFMSKSKPGLQDVVRALLCGVEEARLNAAREIRRLTKTSAKNRADLAELGVIPPLVSMLKCTGAEFQEAAMLALLNLAVQNERNKVQIVKSGAVVPLVELLHSEHVNLRESAAVVILTLSATSANKPVIGHSGAVPILVNMLTSSSLQGKVDAVLALYSLSMHSDNLMPILRAGAASPLVVLLKDCKKASKVAEKIIALLESLMAFEEARSGIAGEKGGILAVVEVLEEGSLQAREHAVSLLLAMCESDRCRYRQAILEEGVIPGLLELTVQGTATAREKARLLLRLLRDVPESSRNASASGLIGSIVADIAYHVDKEDMGTGSAKRVLTEMVQRSMEQSMKKMHQWTVISSPSKLSR